MRPLLDPKHSELAAILSDLLACDVDITAREVARRHSTLQNASAFTRNPERAALINDAQVRQKALRSIALEPHHRKVSSVTERLREQTEEAQALRAQVSALVTSHVACIRAVLRHGGMPALERFWVDYQAIGAAVRDAGAMPPGADVIQLPPRS